MNKAALPAALAVSAVLAAFAACSAPEPATGGRPHGETPAATEFAAKFALPPHPVSGDFPGLDHLAEVAPGLYRAAAPEADEAYALLSRLGVKTILSVDGARPDVEAAARHGIRYVHVPLEYAGITREQVMRISKVAVEAREKGVGLMVHCHHGRHRGPAACAVAWMASAGVPTEKALGDLKRAGTDPRYAGLYEAVREFVPPTPEELARVRPEDLPPVAAVPDLVDGMVRADGSWTRMTAVKKAGWKIPESHPDVRPAHEARILAERFREIARLETVRGKPDDFRRILGEAERAGWDLEAALQAGDKDAAAAAFDRAAASCLACHRQYRDKHESALSGR